jgi:hypothetical protein
MDAELERTGNEYVTIEESRGGQLGTRVKERTCNVSSKGSRWTGCVLHWSPFKPPF